MFNEDNKTVADAQKIMLEILIKVHNICEKNKLTYWLEAGTLLGAVRHKGFIPWDDDIDISMPRKDYERFLEIAQYDLGTEYFLQTKETDPDYKFGFAKVRKNNTLLIESGETGEENYHHGIFIDIFPNDDYQHSWFIDLMEWHSTFRDQRKNFKPGSAKRVMFSIYANIFMWLPIHIIGALKKYAISKREALFSDPESRYISFTLDSYTVRKTERTSVLPVVLSKGCFEGHDFYVPKDPHYVLVNSFGKNYMQLPPIYNRKTHSKFIKTNI